MTLPAAVREAVEASLEGRAREPRIVEASRVGGGCIHQGTRITMASEERYFLKWNRRTPPGMFEAEAEGLRALRTAAAGHAVVPEPLAWRDGPGEEDPSWLLMEYVEPARTGPAGAALGEALARVHAAGSALAEAVAAAGRGGTSRSAGPATGDPARSEPRDAGAPAIFGWTRDNWIGALPQPNTPGPHWGAFWRDRRLRPQLERARAAGRLPDDVFDRAAEAGAAALDRERRPELLHGDLWSGNTFTAASGAPVLVDPAVALGDGEVDLAMSELFGGFGADFHRAYDEQRPVSDAYDAFTRDLYQLYYLLVHVNLFGSGYERPAGEAARRVVAALRG